MTSVHVEFGPDGDIECGLDLSHNKHYLWQRIDQVKVFLVLSWLTCGYAMVGLWLRSGKQEWTPQVQVYVGWNKVLIKVWAGPGPQKFCYLGIVGKVTFLSVFAYIYRIYDSLLCK